MKLNARGETIQCSSMIRPGIAAKPVLIRWRPVRVAERYYYLGALKAVSMTAPSARSDSSAPKAAAS